MRLDAKAELFPAAMSVTLFLVHGTPAHSHHPQLPLCGLPLDKQDGIYVLPDWEQQTVGAWKRPRSDL
jgi:hypothetical protein